MSDASSDEDSIPVGTTIGPASPTAQSGHILVTLHIPPGKGADAAGYVRIDIKNAVGNTIHYVQQTLSSNAWLNTNGGAYITFFIPVFENQTASLHSNTGDVKVKKFEVIYP